MLVHAPPQSVSPVAHAQLPAEQNWPNAQLRPHVPHAVGSVIRFTQRPAHITVPDGHAMHAPPLQTCAAGQAFPHAPQFCASFWKFTQ
jgi:hypothetical protein